ncbi:MAG TPA: hypothetical protein VGP43_02540 [Chitinophagaceae bacterium]|nr:hypothetical protein [Chitinophagaceae bacterium]
MEITLCNICKNYLGDLKCQAFPQGIPEQILNGENNHTEPLSDQDNEIVFEMDKKIKDISKEDKKKMLQKMSSSGAGEILSEIF